MGETDLRDLIREIVERELKGLSVPQVPAALSPAPAPTPVVPPPPAPVPAPAAPATGPAKAPGAAALEIRIGEKVLTAQDLEAVPAGSTVVIKPGTLVTPLVREVAAGRRIRVRFADEGGKPSVALAADHGGFRMKETVKALLAELGYPFFDYGTDSESPVDYPEYAHKVARAVSENHHELGIIVDGAGIGSCMAANKVPGVRAAQCNTPALARNSREHNFANVLTLGGKAVSPEEAREIVKAWLETPWGEERHARRVRMIGEIERRYLKE